MSIEQEAYNKRMSDLFTSINDQLKSENKSSHVILVASLLLSLQNRLNISPFQMILTLISVFNDLEKVNSEIKSLEEVEELLKNKKEKGIKKPGWAIATFEASK
jgi:hypothetical protein